jgi:hypothetical protein
MNVRIGGCDLGETDEVVCGRRLSVHGENVTLAAYAISLGS